MTIYGLVYGHLLTQDDADQLECVIGYATSLYLVIKLKVNFVDFMNGNTKL